MNELPIQTRTHIFTNKNDNTLMREFEVILNESYHLFNFVQMINTNILAQAKTNDVYWNAIYHHRELLTSMSGVDYTPDIRKRIRLLSPDDVIDDWYNDYKDMRSSMIYGGKPTFEELMRKIKELENMFHK